MNLNDIIKKSRNAQEQYLRIGVSLKEILSEVKMGIENSFDLLEKAYQVESTEELSLTKMLKQFDVDFELHNEPFLNEFGRGGNMEVPYGVLGVISDSDVYKILRILILGLLTRNSLIINVTKNVGVNFMLIKMVEQILERHHVEGFVQVYNNNVGDVLEESEQIDGIIYIGKKTDADRLKVSYTKPVIYSGCGNYEIYIENVLDENLINKIVKEENIRVYSKVGIGLGQEVSGIEEAIAKIQEYGSEYSVGIITENTESAKEFVARVKARNVFVNASPFLIKISGVNIIA